MTKKYCPQCGTENKKENRFCIRCGTSFDEMDVKKENKTTEITDHILPKEEKKDETINKESHDRKESKQKMANQKKSTGNKKKFAIGAGSLFFLLAIFYMFSNNSGLPSVLSKKETFISSGEDTEGMTMILEIDGKKNGNFTVKIGDYIGSEIEIPEMMSISTDVALKQEIKEKTIRTYSVDHIKTFEITVQPTAFMYEIMMDDDLIHSILKNIAGDYHFEDPEINEELNAFIQDESSYYSMPYFDIDNLNLNDQEEFIRMLQEISRLAVKENRQVYIDEAMEMVDDLKMELVDEDLPLSDEIKIDVDFDEKTSEMKIVIPDELIKYGSKLGLTDLDELFNSQIEILTPNHPDNEYGMDVDIARILIDDEYDPDFILFKKD